MNDLRGKLEYIQPPPKGCPWVAAGRLKILLVLAAACVLWPIQADAGVITKPVIQDGLVAYWSFDTGIGGVKAPDMSGNAKDGTLTLMDPATDWVVGKFGRALHFDASNDYVSVPPVALPGTFTMSFWYKAPANYGGVVLGEDSGAEGGGPKIVKTTDNIFVRIISSSQDVSAPSTHSEWHHIVITRNSSDKVDIYIDSSGPTRLFSDAAQTGAYTINALGTNGGTPSQYFNGYLDDIRIYNRALAGWEILKLYQRSGNATLNSSSVGKLANGLVGHWTFDGNDTYGTKTYDKSGQGNTGTLVGGPTATLGRLGQALAQAAQNEYVTMGDPASGVLDFGTGDFSVGGWFKALGYISGGSSVNFFIDKFDNDGGCFCGYGLYLTSANKVSFSAGGASLTSDATYNDNAFHHILGVRSGTSIFLYIDGVLKKTTTGAGSTVSTGGSFDVGGDNTLGRDLSGAYDDIRAYNRALSAEEVKRLYEMGAPSKVSTTPKNRLTQGLVGHWTFDGNDMTPKVLDKSGQNNHGFLSGFTSTTTVIGRLGQALSFDGSDDYVSLGTFNPSSSDLTLSTWFYAYSPGTPYFQGLLAKRDSFGASDMMWQLFFNGTNRIDFSSTGGGAAVVNYTIPTRTWTHLIVTKHGSTITFYINGANSASGSMSFDSDTTALVQIGRTSSSENFNGQLDDVRVYNRALSADEVKQLYNMGR